MRALVLNTVVYNSGDAAILLGLVEAVRSAYGDDTEVQVVDDAGLGGAALYPELQFVAGFEDALKLPWASRVRGRPRRALALARLRLGAMALRRPRSRWIARGLLAETERAALATLLAADVVLSSGGTYLVEHYPMDNRLLRLQLALDLGRPLVLFTQSLGPFERRGNRRWIRRIVSGSSLVLLRDGRSLGHLRAIGAAGGHLQVVPDAVFSLAAPTPEVRHEPALRVALSVRHWPYGAVVQGRDTRAEYVAAVSAGIVRLVEGHGAEVVMLSTCQGTPEYWIDDSDQAAEIADALPAHVRRSVTVDRDFHRPETLLRLLAGVDLVIATRMHMAILSLVAGRPVLAIAYEFKTLELFEGLALGRWALDLDLLSSELLVERTDAILADRPRVQRSVRAAADRAAHDAQAVGAMLGQAVPPAPARR